MQNRSYILLAACALLSAAVGQTRADMVTVSDSGRGWVGTTVASNGNAAGNDYFAGSEVGDVGGGQYRNHFDFPIPALPGGLVSATINIDNGDSGEVGPYYDFGSQTYSLYSLGAFGTYGFSDIGSGTFYGSLEISTEGIETISLNAAALADITADQGGTFSLGGIDSGETAYLATTEGNFAFTTSDNSVSLALVTTPEPSSLALLVLGAVGLCLAARRCR